MADVWFLNAPASATAGTGLRTQVGGLVQAMSAFQATQVAPSPDANAGVLPGTQAAAGAGMSVNVGTMVNAMRQFDPNALAIAPQLSVGGVPVAGTLTSGLNNQNSSSGGILATGK